MVTVRLVALQWPLAIVSVGLDDLWVMVSSYGSFLFVHKFHLSFRHFRISFILSPVMKFIAFVTRKIIFRKFGSGKAICVEKFMVYLLN